MKIDWKFLKQILLTLIVIGVLSIYPVMNYATPEITSAIIAGALLTTINVLLGYAAIEYSFGKSTTTFVKYVLGGMGIRLLLMTSTLFILVKAFDFHSIALICSIGFFYIIFLTLEILFIQKKINIKHHG